VNKLIHAFIALVILYSFSSAQDGHLAVVPQQEQSIRKSGRLEGSIIDALTEDKLPGANVMIKGSGLGSASDLNGYFSIPNIPPGSYIILVQYIGYKDKEIPVVVNPGETVEQDIKLDFDILVGDEIVVTAQAEGQLKAINQQLTSDVIMNVVSSEQIQELPDQNVAESIARLPGISVTRQAGEAQGVTIRGLAPKYNQIQIDGVPMSSAASSIETGMRGLVELSQSRAVDLSVVSQENLQSIEVYKSLTPDMDANTLGGTVNLRLGKADPELLFEARLFGSYNRQEKDVKQYKAYARMSGRFWSNKLGVQLSINSDKRNRGNDGLSAGYDRIDVRDQSGELTGETVYKFTSGIVSDERLIRTKHGVNAIFDYDIAGTELLFSNFGTWGNSHRLGLSRFWVEELRFVNSETESESYMISNSLRGMHDVFSGLEIEWNISHYRNKTEIPFNGYIDWYQKDYSGDVLSEMDPKVVHPEDYMAALPTDGELIYKTTEMRISHVADVKYVGKLDIKFPFYLSNQLSGFLKGGGLFKQIERESREKAANIYRGRHVGPDPMVDPFFDDYDPNPVLDGKTKLGFSLNADTVSNCWDVWRYSPKAYWDNPLIARNINYDMTEKYSAGYLMLELKTFDNLLTFIPGVRYERSDISGNGYYKYTFPAPGQPTGDYEPRQSDETFDYWLPMVNLKVKPAEWLDVRLAVTKTLSRPDFIYRVPYETVPGVERGEPSLKATTSWNYDINTSLYDNQFGLFTIGIFYKEISNFSYMIEHFIKDSATAYEYGLPPTANYLFQKFRHPENTHGISTIKGLEVEYQANLSYLPGLLRNIVFRINYTRLISKSFLKKYRTYFDENYRVYYDTGFREGPLPTQPSYIANGSIGYDIGGLSIRLSAFFQGENLVGVGNLPESDTYVEAYNRWDFSLRYRFNNYLSLLMGGVNITNTHDSSSLRGNDKYSSYTTFGSIYDLGLEYTY
jgi:TonB-dependent receptor